MNIAMFIVGTAVFTTFIIFIAWDIGYNEDKVNEDNRGYYERHNLNYSDKKSNAKVLQEKTKRNKVKLKNK